MSTISDFGITPFVGGRPTHKPKGKNAFPSDRCREPGHGDHHFRHCPDRTTAKERFRDKKPPRSEDVGPTNGGNREPAYIKESDKQPASILKKGSSRKNSKSPIQYSDAVKHGEAMSSNTVQSRNTDTRKPAKVTPAHKGKGGRGSTRGGTSWLKWGEGEEPYSTHSGTWEGDPPIHTMDHNSEGHAVKLKVVPIGTGVNFKGLVKLKFGTMKPTIMLTITALRGH